MGYPSRIAPRRTLGKAELHALVGLVVLGIERAEKGLSLASGITVSAAPTAAVFASPSSSPKGGSSCGSS